MSVLLYCAEWTMCLSVCTTVLSEWTMWLSVYTAVLCRVDYVTECLYCCTVQSGLCGWVSVLLYCTEWTMWLSILLYCAEWTMCLRVCTAVLYRVDYVAECLYCYTVQSGLCGWVSVLMYCTEWTMWLSVCTAVLYRVDYVAECLVCTVVLYRPDYVAECLYELVTDDSKNGAVLTVGETRGKSYVSPYTQWIIKQKAFGGSTQLLPSYSFEKSTFYPRNPTP